jgi:hypothetical protein
MNSSEKWKREGELNMGIFDYISTFIVLVPVIVIVVLFVVKRGKYKNKSNAGAFFFENGCLVLNTGIPYPIPLEDIDHVELSYSPWELENRLSYSLGVKVLKRDGKKKWVYYKGYKTAKLATPYDMEAALKERGIRCVMVEE